MRGCLPRLYKISPQSNIPRTESRRVRILAWGCKVKTNPIFKCAWSCTGNSPQMLQFHYGKLLKFHGSDFSYPVNLLSWKYKSHVPTITQFLWYKMKDHWNMFFFHLLYLREYICSSKHFSLCVVHAFSLYQLLWWGNCLQCLKS